MTPPNPPAWTRTTTFTEVIVTDKARPYVLGTRPRFVVDRMGPRWKRVVAYTVRSDVRGKFTIGPMKVRLSDAFGMVELDRTFTSTSTLVVTPLVSISAEADARVKLWAQAEVATRMDLTRFPPDVILDDHQLPVHPEEDR